MGQKQHEMFVHVGHRGYQPICRCGKWLDRKETRAAAEQAGRRHEQTGR